MSVIIVVERHPDRSNDFHTFTDPPVISIVNVDYGRTDLSDYGEFAEWAENLESHAGDLIGTPAGNEAADYIRGLVVQAKEDYGPVKIP